jgi:FlaA1/EpsC-like NDP-sugar epimerase
MKSKRPKLQVIKYLTIDFCSALLAWTFFYIFRKKSVDPNISTFDILTSGENTFILGIVFIPLFWLLLYYVAGEYHDIYHKSRLQELGRTLFISFLGLIIIFFILILDDIVFSYQSYYWSFAYLWCWHFCLTYSGRVILTTNTIKKIRNKKIGFKTLIIGSNEQALQLYRDLECKPKSAGWHFVGFITVNGSTPAPLDQHLPYLGKLDQLIEIINREQIEEVIIAIEPSERTKIQQIMVKVKAKPMSLYQTQYR